MGGLVAFELTRSLRRLNLPRPTQLIISACAAPHLPILDPLIHTLPDDKFLKSLKDFSGTTSEILDQPELMQLLLPALRADFELIETYQFASASPLDCPITAFGGLDDPRVSREQIEGWAVHTNSNFESKFFDGDHFFINSQNDAVIRSIATKL